MERLKNCCDLHVHSVFSDGTWTPKQLVDEAERIGLSSIALTDHNTVSGVEALFQAAKGKNVEAIAGIEFSTDYGEKELHIIGLFIQPQHFPRIHEMVEGIQQRKVASNYRLAENLRKGGYDVHFEEIVASTPDGHVNRVHFASELVKKGYVRSVQEAFHTLLSKRGGFYEEPKRLPVYEIIAFLKEINAVSVLAHPFLNLTEEELTIFLPKAIGCGLDGMETEYATFDEAQTAKAKEIAKAFGLKQSGGSDFHGENKPDISLGVGKGNLRISQSFVESLRRKIK